MDSRINSRINSSFVFSLKGPGEADLLERLKRDDRLEGSRGSGWRAQGLMEGSGGSN